MSKDPDDFMRDTPSHNKQRLREAKAELEQQRANVRAQVESIRTGPGAQLDRDHLANLEVQRANLDGPFPDGALRASEIARVDASLAAVRADIARRERTAEGLELHFELTDKTTSPGRRAVAKKRLAEICEEGVLEGFAGVIFG